MIRTFIAVDIAESVRNRAGELIESLEYGGDGVKWVAPSNMHLTLKFLGDVPQSDVSRVCEAVAGAVAGQERFTISLQGAGAFPSIARPRTVWLGVAEGAEELHRLLRPIQRALKKMGYPKESRQFQPHLTLGRIRRGGPALQQLTQHLRDQQAYDAGSTVIDQVVVYASQLGPSGPTYQALSRIPLG